MSEAYTFYCSTEMTKPAERFLIAMISSITNTAIHRLASPIRPSVVYSVSCTPSVNTAVIIPSLTIMMMMIIIII